MVVAKLQRRHASAGIGIIAYAACVTCAALVVIAACLFPQTALAVDMAKLNHNFQIASTQYEQAVADQSRNADEIAHAEESLSAKEAELEDSREDLAATAVALYKSKRTHSDLVELLVGSYDFYDAVMRFETYARVQSYYSSKIEEAVAKHAELSDEKARLEQEKQQADAAVEDARKTLEVAEAALLDAENSKGADFHQVQGNGQNCGATAFIVSVNALLHENRFTDNVEVWEGPGFERNSTINLAQKGQEWLKANELDDQISIESIPGDIHQASQLKEQLEQGNMVVISSGAQSVWQRADGSEVGPGAFPGGHFIMFYNYENGVFFANDSSAIASKGAGCPYTEEQLQAWLDGRSYHSATALKLKELEEGEKDAKDAG